MEFLKGLFTEALTFEAFSKAVKDKGFKLADLSSGEYVAKGKLTELSDKNKALNATITDLNGQITAFDGKDGELADLKKKVNDYETAENKRAENERKANADKEMTDKIIAVFGDKKFVSPYVERGIIADIKALFEQDSTKGIEKIFAELTTDKEGIFASEAPSVVMKGMGNPKSGVTPEEFKKMGYADRLKIKTEQPNLFKTLTE